MTTMMPQAHMVPQHGIQMESQPVYGTGIQPTSAGQPIMHDPKDDMYGRRPSVSKTVGYTNTAHTVEYPMALEQNMGVRLMLRPWAPPSAMGLAAFFASTWWYGTWLAGWFGSDVSLSLGFGYVMIFGGLGQFIAGLQGYPARDAFATVFHTAWGSFYLGLGLQILFGGFGSNGTGTGTGTTGTTTGIFGFSQYYGNDEVAMWLVTLAAISWICVLAALFRDFSTTMTMLFVAAGSTLVLGGYFANSRKATKAGGYFLMVSALFALWRVFHFLMEEGWQELPTWFPNFRTRWERRRAHIQIPTNEPGVKKGQ